MITNNLVTVTCTRDLKQMILQSHSIDLFVTTPCTHWVFIEDTHLSEEAWLNVLNPYYKRHTLRLFYNYLKDFGKGLGWTRQQIIKLYAVKQVKDDYLILDSKNFFIKSTNLDWDLIESCGFREEIDNHNSELFGKSFYTFITEYLGKDIGNTFYSPHTPFRVRKQVVRKLLKTLDLFEIYEKCISGGFGQSEFILYSFFTDLDIKECALLYNDYIENSLFYTYWFNRHLKSRPPERTEVLGIHRNCYFNKRDDLKELASWLNKKGIDKDILDAVVNMKWINRDVPFLNIINLVKNINCDIALLKDICKNHKSAPVVYYTALNPNTPEESVNLALERFPNLVNVIDFPLFDEFEHIFQQEKYISPEAIGVEYNETNITNFYKLRNAIVEDYKNTTISYIEILEKHITRLI